MDLNIKEITLPAFLWYILPGLTFVLVVIATPVLLLDPSQLLGIGSLGGVVFILLVALIAGFVMDSLKLYALGFRHEGKKQDFFKTLAGELGMTREQVAALIDALRLGLSERGPFGKAVAFNHSRWVMMTHSAKCFYLFAGVWAIVTVALHVQGDLAWYQTELGLEHRRVATLVDAGLVALMIAIGIRIDAHAAGQRRACDKLYYAYARRYATELRAELLGPAESGGRLDEESFLRSLKTVANLKTIKRKGWQRHGLQDGESVADHTFMTCMLAYLLAPHAGVDRGRSVLLALVHDVPESIVGDFTPDEIAPADKRALETDAASRLASEFADPELLRLWEEAEAGDSVEARFVRDLDGLEPALQARIYEDSDGAPDLGEFYVSARKRIAGDLALRLLDRIASSRGQSEGRGPSG